jgi:hypothetical protein
MAEWFTLDDGSEVLFESVDQLLEDPLYLLAVDPAQLVPHLDAARSALAPATAAVYRQSAHLLADLGRPMRASQLELTATSLHPSAAISERRSTVSSPAGQLASTSVKVRPAGWPWPIPMAVSFAC